jgi:ketopantoate reductase
VTLLDRGDHGSDSMPADLTINLSGDVVGSHTFPSQKISEAQEIEHLLVCTKSWAIGPAIASVAHRLSQDSTVVIMCNGMGHAELIEHHLNGATLVLGSTTAGCRLTAAGTRQISGSGATYLGNSRPHLSRQIGYRFGKRAYRHFAGPTTFSQCFSQKWRLMQ